MLVFHIPHSSAVIPVKLRAHFMVNDNEIAHELLRLTDWFTDMLFEDSEAESLIFPISRLVCDPERFLDDALEPAASVGMGVTYTRGSKGQIIREIDKVTRGRLIEDYYDPHHAALENLVTQNLDEFGVSFVLDCHSFPVEPLPTDEANTLLRPDICLGFDPFHAPQELIQEIQKALESEGLNVSLNSPYSGSLVPASFYQKNPQVLGLMVEINRSLYMDEKTGNKNNGFDTTKSLIQKHITQKIKQYLQDTLCGQCCRAFSVCQCNSTTEVWNILCPYCDSKDACVHYRGVYDASYGSYSGDLEEIVTTTSSVVLRKTIEAARKSESLELYASYFGHSVNEIATKIQEHLDEIESEIGDEEDIDIVKELIDSLEFEFDIDVEEMISDWLDDSDLIISISGIDTDECIDHIIYSEFSKEDLKKDCLMYLESLKS
ncbi:N-formylglutamate amidohydrolase [Gammaproteobacteria bacterium]|nr:N-formylglutamate amidohydrolase [Gammaproteobacteria bacterium]